MRWVRACLLVIRILSALSLHWSRTPNLTSLPGLWRMYTQTQLMEMAPNIAPFFFLLVVLEPGKSQVRSISPSLPPCPYSMCQNWSDKVRISVALAHGYWTDLETSLYFHILWDLPFPDSPEMYSLRYHPGNVAPIPTTWLFFHFASYPAA